MVKYKMKRKTENFKKLNDKEREVYLRVTAILDVTEESTEFTKLLQLALEGY